MKMPILYWLTAGAAALALAACGGGGGGGDAGSSGPVSPTSSGAIPASAVSSTQAFVDYLQRQSPADDTIEPLTLQQLLPPKDDTAEPTPLA